jgi:Lrp/AsnC family leucine-responsive transcriptional regulator
MDNIDRKLLQLIQTQGRASYAELGADVELSVSAVNERLKKLQNQKIILGWGAAVNAKAVGVDVLAFINVLIDRPEYERNFKEAISMVPEIQECHAVTGEWSYLLKIRAKTTAHLEALINKEIKAMAGIARTQTLLVLSSVKESAIVDCRE